MCSADMDSGSIPDSFRPQLHLSRLRYTDRGQYFCVARNSLGTDRSGPLLLNVTCESVSCFLLLAQTLSNVQHMHASEETQRADNRS